MYCFHRGGIQPMPRFGLGCCWSQDDWSEWNVMPQNTGFYGDFNFNPMNPSGFGSFTHSFSSKKPSKSPQRATAGFLARCLQRLPAPRSAETSSSEPPSRLHLGPRHAVGVPGPCPERLFPKESVDQLSSHFVRNPYFSRPKKLKVKKMDQLSKQRLQAASMSLTSRTSSMTSKKFDAFA